MASPPGPPTPQIPQSFRDCYLSCEKYPGRKAVVAHNRYGDATLGVYRKRFKEREPTLLVIDGVDGRQVKVPVRDVLKDGSVFKSNIMTEDQLKGFLGDTTSPANPNAAVATKEDPRCRFVFLINDMVTSPLEISTDFLTRIFTYHQVMPSFLDFLYVYGRRLTEFGKDREIRFSGFRTERVFVNPDQGNVIPDLKRSGRRYQMSYNIKAVVLKRVDVNEKAVIDKIWKIRQAAIHHQFDVGTGCQLWVFGDPHAALKARVGESFSEHENHSSRLGTLQQSFKTSLDINLLNCQWAMEGWLEHIQSQEDIVDNLTEHLLSLGHNRDKNKNIRLAPGAIGSVQDYEESTNEAIMVLQSNVDVMTSMTKFYKNIVEDSDFPAGHKLACGSTVRDFSTQLDELIYDATTQIARVRNLAKVIADRKTVLIQHLQAQAADRAEQFTATMWKATERSEKEAIAMRIITVITLIYLPPTFSSTFFSTDVVKYQNPNGGTGSDLNTSSGDAGGGAGLDGPYESTSWLALSRWLEVSLPLMLLTFGVAVCWYMWEHHKRRKRNARLRQEHPDVFARADAIGY